MLNTPRYMEYHNVLIHFMNEQNPPSMRPNLRDGGFSVVTPTNKRDRFFALFYHNYTANNGRGLALLRE